MAERVAIQWATSWALLNTLVVLYALLPVVWILSLSLKPTSTVRDGKLIPTRITLDNYRAIFDGHFFSPALVNERVPRWAEPRLTLRRARACHP